MYLGTIIDPPGSRVNEIPRSYTSEGLYRTTLVLHKVGRVAQFWAAAEPLAPRTEQRKKCAFLDLGLYARSRDGDCCAGTLDHLFL